MPSIYNIINPVSEQVNADLQRDREQQALDAEKLQGPGLWDLAKTASDAAYVNGVGFKLVGRIFNDPDIKYDEKQLTDLYPDTPQNYFKGGASAYQAEMLYDKFKRQQDVEVVKSLIYGGENTSDPDWWVIGRKGRNLVPALSSIVTSFADPLTIPAMMLGSSVSSAALPIASRFAPEVTKRVAMAIGTSRLASNWFPEVMSNLAFEAASNYGVGKLNADFTKEDPTLKDAVINSVGTALVFGSASALLKGYNVNFLKDSALHINDAILRGFKFNKNMASMAGDSAVHNVHMMQEAVKDYIRNPLDSAESSADKITKRSLTHTGEEAFNSNGAAHIGVVDTEGNTLYTGTRHGDNHVFIDDPKAVQGMVNEYNTNGEQNLKVVTSTQLNAEGFNLANLDSELANTHPDILNIIDNHLGNVSDLDINDASTLNDVFKAIDNAKVSGDISGSDLRTMYDEISSNLNKKGFDGMRFVEDIDGKTHTVSEIFPDKLQEYTELGDGESTAKATEISDPLDADIVVSGGKIIPAEPALHDPSLELDEDFKNAYTKFNDPEYVKKIEMDDFNKHVEEDAKLKEEDLRQDIKADAKLIIKDASESIKDDLNDIVSRYPPIDELTDVEKQRILKEFRGRLRDTSKEISDAIQELLADSNELSKEDIDSLIKFSSSIEKDAEKIDFDRFKLQLEAAKEKVSYEAPEKAGEIFKVLENCKGKS